MKIKRLELKKMIFHNSFLPGKIIIIRGRDFKNNFLIKYEDLVLKPQKEIKRLIEFLKQFFEIPFQTIR